MNKSQLLAAVAGLTLLASGCGGAASAPATPSAAASAPPAQASAAAKPAPASSPSSAKPAVSGASASAKPAASGRAAAKPAASGSAAAGSAVPKTNGQYTGGDPNGTPIKISYASPAVSGIPFYAAVSYDFFKQQHLNVTMIRLAANVAVTALSKGEIDFGDSPSNIIAGATRGLPFKVVYSAWQKAPWTIYGKKEFNSLADLKGHTLGTNLPGSSPFKYMQAGLKKAGLQQTDLKIFSSNGTQVTYTQLIAGQVDAAVLSPPFDAQAEAAGFHEIMFLGDQLALPYIGLGATTATLSQKRPVVVSTIRALLDASTWLKTHPVEAAGLVVSYSGAPPDIAKRSVERMIPTLTQTGEITPEGIQQALDIQSEESGAKVSQKPTDVVDWGPLHEALGKA